MSGLNPSGLGENKTFNSAEAESVNTDVSRTKTEPVANVKAYGAIGDGATNDTQAIQDAADAAGVGGELYFPDGTYLVDYPGPDVLDKQRWRGSDDATIRAEEGQTVTNTGGVINVYGSDGDKLSRVTFENLEIDANKNNITLDESIDSLDVEGIDVKWCETIGIRRCNIHDAPSDGADFDESTTIRVEQSTFEDNGGAGVHHSSDSTTIVITGSEAINNGWDHNRPGFDMSSFADGEAFFFGNVATDNYKNYALQGSQGFFLANESNGDTDSVDTFNVSFGFLPGYESIRIGYGSDSWPIKTRSSMEFADGSNGFGQSVATDLSQEFGDFDGEIRLNDGATGDREYYWYDQPDGIWRAVSDRTKTIAP